MSEENVVDVAIVGAGFGGIAALHAIRAIGLSAIVIDAASGPGGTWYWNRYPGARCDIESRQYSYGIFPDIAQTWTWSEKFATQSEILRYLEHVVTQEEMAGVMRFNTRVEAAHYDDAGAIWRLTTDKGDMIAARYCIMATGTLSTANLPAIPGIEDFKGELYHTGLWPHEGVDLANKRVGVIGVGSSGIQIIPVAANVAEHLTVFLRTPYYVVPSGNRPTDLDEDRDTKAEYIRLRAEWRCSPNAMGLNFGTKGAMEVDDAARHAIFEAAWEIGGGDFGACFTDLSRNMDSNAEVEKYFRWKIGQIIEDPQTAAMLMPAVQWGTRRLCMGTDYYETYNRENVSVVDLRKTPIDHVTQGGIVCGGVEHGLDVLVLATGFDAVTGTLLRMDIRGRDGATLKEVWNEGARTYLGMMVAGFPNMFMISGPQTPGTLINMAAGSEMHADWIGRCIAWIEAQDAVGIEPTQEAQIDWLHRTNAVAEKSLMSKSTSWWTGANIPGKPRGYLGYVDWPGFVARCEQVAQNDYEGFILHRNGGAAAMAQNKKVAVS